VEQVYFGDNFKLKQRINNKIKVIQ